MKMLFLISLLSVNCLAVNIDAEIPAIKSEAVNVSIHSNDGTMSLMLKSQECYKSRPSKRCIYFDVSSSVVDSYLYQLMMDRFGIANREEYFDPDLIAERTAKTLGMSIEESQEYLLAILPHVRDEFNDLFNNKNKL